VGVVEAVVVVWLVARMRKVTWRVNLNTQAKYWVPIVLMFVMQCGCNNETPPPSAVKASTTVLQEPAPISANTKDYFETSGPLVVENQVEVLAQREGFVSLLFAEVGQRVQKGQVLAQIDDRQLSADREAQEARVRSISADVKNWEAEARVLENDYQRDEEMFKAQLITAKQLEHSKYKLIGAGYQLERERQNEKNAVAALRSIDLELEKTRIMAPFAGVVARRYIRQGARVQANDRMYWVTATAPINVQFTLPEMFLGKISPGQNVVVIAVSGVKNNARVRLVSPVADPSSGTIEVMAELTDAPPTLMPGTNAIVRVSKPR
jgi:membrane fusion protein, multidrug efflux system